MERFYDNDPEDKDKEHVFGSDDGDDDDNDDEDDDDDGDDDDGDEEAIAIMDQQGIIDVMNLDLAQVELNQNLLDKAIKIAKSGWFWRFKSNTTKLKEIEEIYKKLMTLTEQGGDKDEDDTEEDSEED